MKRYLTTEDFISGNDQWKEELLILRDVLLETEMEETIKWGAPVYTINGKNVVGLGAFKSYVGIWFFQGALLKDKSNILFNAQEGKTKALRQWRFKNAELIDIGLIKKYVLEAIDNQKKDLTIKIEKKKTLETPAIMMEKFEENSGLKASFLQFTPFKQREFIVYILEPKKDVTKTSRLQKIIPMIINSQGLNDKYR